MKLLRVIPNVAPNARSVVVDARLSGGAGRDHPELDIRLGLTVAAVFFIGFIGWAALAPLDAAAYADGRLSVIGQRQTVQHREGGVVAELLVREGQHVEQGQVLLRLAGAEVRAQERALAAQAITLLAQRARLEADQLRRSTILPPAEFGSLPVEDRAEAARALRLQAAQLRAGTAARDARAGAIGQRTVRASEQGVGYNRQAAATAEQVRLINEELESLRPIAAQGFVSQTRIRQLERAKAELEGRLGQYQATVGETRASVAETRLQVIESERDHQERVAGELRNVLAALSQVLPRLVAARDQLSRSEIRAPVSGAVLGLSVNTVGGVIGPGQKLMDIVPSAASLVVEAKLAPDYADDVQVGQEAALRLPTLHDSGMPPLKGSVTRVSADTFIDQRTGASFFTAEISVPPEEQLSVQKRHGQNAFRAGVPVDTVIVLRKRTALQYALEPLTEAFSRSFGEE